MATNFLIALATAFGSATMILLVLRLLLKVFAPDAFKEMIPIEKGQSNREIARDLNLSEADIKDYLLGTWKVYSKRPMRLQLGERQYKLVLRHNLEQNPFHEREDSAIEDEVVEHGETLELHSKQFEDLEKRIRRLEIESVQKLQEATEEKPQAPQAVH